MPRIALHIGLWAALLCCLVLLCAINPWAYWYFMAMRVLVFSSGLYLAWLLRTEETWLRVLFVIAALLFNPFFPAHLDVVVWRILDLAGFFLFLTAAGEIQGRLKET